MTLQNYLLSLNVEQLRELYNSLLDAGLCNEYKANTKAIFKRLRNQSSGKLKKIYAALAHANQQQYEFFFEILTNASRV